jgi:two-component system sensor histidine kinase RegB
MWVGFAITALFIVFFVGRIQQALATHETALAQLREEKSRADRLASLATLAAGAAHEFSTPLATITVAAGEMLHTLNKLGDQEELLEDALLIRDQVNRCKDILFQMSSDAGEHLGESFTAFTLAELFDALRANLGKEAGSRVDIICEEQHLSLKMPSRSLKRSLKGLVANGLEASGQSNRVTLRCWSDPTRLWFEVKDTGFGMTGEIRDRAVEPFFTTREPGRGLGLGLFLAKSLAESFGGDLAIESAPGQGTTVRLWFNLREVLA